MWPLSLIFDTCRDRWELLQNLPLTLTPPPPPPPCLPGEDKATIPVTDTEFNQTGNPQSFCTGVSVHHQALIQNTGPLIDMSDIRPGTSEYTETCPGRRGHNVQWVDPLSCVPAFFYFFLFEGGHRLQNFKTSKASQSNRNLDYCFLCDKNNS